jgi:hypothetical protein
MRQVAAALAASRALASPSEAPSRAPALPEEPIDEAPARRRRSWRRVLTLSAWKPTHARG